jgi:hypothetical protein
VESVYDHLRSNAGRDEETGTLVTHAPLHPWLVDRFGMTAAQAKSVRTAAVKELESQGRVRRDHPRSTKVWILK